MKNLVLLSTTIAVSYLTALPAISQTFPNEVHKKLILLDRKVSQGHLYFDRTFQTGGEESSESHEFSFNAHHCYKDSYVLSDPSHSRLTICFDGTDSFLSAGKTITIGAGLPRNASHDQALMDVTPYPSFPMGRGLSSLKDFTAQHNGKWIEIKGHTLSGIYITAEVDPSDHYLAREIEIRNTRGDWRGFWRTYRNISQGMIASKAVYTPSISDNSLKSAFNFKKADFVSQSDEEFICPIKEKITIVDERLGSSVTLLKMDSGSISKNEVLRRTRLILEERGKEKRTYSLVGLTQNLVNALLVLLPMLLIGVWFSIRQSRAVSRKTI